MVLPVEGLTRKCAGLELSAMAVQVAGVAELPARSSAWAVTTKGPSASVRVSKLAVQVAAAQVPTARLLTRRVTAPTPLVASAAEAASVMMPRR